VTGLVEIPGSARMRCSEPLCKSQGNVVTATHKHNLVAERGPIDKAAILTGPPIDSLLHSGVRMDNSARVAAYRAQNRGAPLTVRQARQLARMARRHGDALVPDVRERLAAGK